MEIPDLVNFFRKKGISEYRIMRYIPITQKLPIKVKEHYFDIYLDALSKIFNDIENEKVSIEVEDPPLTILKILPSKLKGSVIYSPCRGLYNTITIESDGRVSLCPVYVKDVDYGNVKTDSLKSILSKTYEKAKACKSIASFCKGCEYFEDCSGGCRCSAYYNAYKTDKPDPFCIKHRGLLK
jgi:radical SAM protein with 4Fe4S-binding SPASM domain